jgi:hypothetical protein
MAGTVSAMFKVVPKLPNEKPVFERPPFNTACNLDQGPVNRSFERAMRRESDCHIRGRKKTLWYLEDVGHRMID